ncbi:MAG: High-affnity carbon uptake protein Hat/HatR [Bacteroidota bacterium]|jgi:energy-coupling factor transporter ATP-binding protein EcfA2|nr:High-affnity carbon uptake protein Hat/HatR [Cytophagales bacterium]MCE2958058.1 High-affnity carbon uptake protein Hat/HatR [Flammeovirgaceae bacterium]MCZ8072094.1 High-affnity carbon uptake protein Hat/HatR [Cytophagales bacterium]
MSQVTTEDLAAGASPLVGTDNPFPGLRPFKIEESHLFFGREGQSDEVLLKLSKSRFVGVIGPSGSGKSSFIYCGVLPILYGGFLTDASPNWEVIVTRPGSSPIDNLSESLLKTAKDYNLADTEDKKIKRTIVSTLLRSSSLGLVEAIQQSRRSADINYLILVDQFEELFRFKDGTDPNSVNESLAFINLLMEAVNYEDSPIYVAITMRSDFIGECAQFPELTRKINDSHYLIPQMTREQKRRAIEGPVAVGQATIAPRLVQQLLNDLGDNPDQLPILQHALMRTWSYWAKYKDYEDEVLDLKHYEAIGTMSEALSMHANEAYDELDEDQQRICEILFKAITEKRGENFGIRRPTRLNEIASICDASEADVIAVIDKFREPGRSLLTPAAGTALSSRSMIDISHESLMRIWVRLKNWVDDESDAVQMYLRLAEAASMYQVGKAGLWRPPDLQLALNWQAKHKPTLVWGQRYNPAFERTIIFLEYSKKEFDTEQRIKELEQKRKLRTARVTAIVFGILAMLALVALVYAFIQAGIATAKEKEARDNFQEAKKQEALAKENEKTAIKEKEKADEEKRKADLAKEEALKARDQANAATKQALVNLDRATKAERDATLQRNEAIAARDEANVQKNAAVAAKALADRRRYLSIAKSMALKSKEVNDPVQQALLAQQAYNFNKKHDGYAFDNDIYNGLYAALDKYDHPLTRSLDGHTKAARAVVTNERTNTIYSGGSDGKVYQWKQGSDGLWKGNLLKEFVAPAPSTLGVSYQIYSLDVSPDGNLLALGGLYPQDRDANYAMLIDISKPNAEPKKINGFVSDIENIAFTPDGKGFFARSNSGRSIMYSDLTSAKEVIATKEKITSIDLSADGSKLAGVSEEGNLIIWDVKKNFAPTSIRVLSGSENDILALSFNPAGNEVVIGDQNGIVRIINISLGSARRVLTGHTSMIEQIKFSHSGDFMATASKDKTVRLWNMKMLKEQPQVLSNNDWVWSMSFSPDDEQLLAGVHSTTESVTRNVEGVNTPTKDFAIHAYPTKLTTMASELCGYAKRNMSQDEWDLFVAEDLPREVTCNNYPLNK